MTKVQKEFQHTLELLKQKEVIYILLTLVIFILIVALGA